ncbi:sensor histidine kinase [Crocinitomix catalasitica]|uniref:sensor histidine kinase n=1 Tax=Crocinitomix catalasitica TaxID=184607 RepID=UPI00048715B9|nr:sensor histidine kinase [Crocinitomix catalasitica]
MPKIISISNNFKNVIHLSVALAICINFYLSWFLIQVSTGPAILSPVIATLIFILILILSIKDLIPVNLIFFIGAYTFGIEAYINTYYFGWDSGVFYYIFLIPLTFLLNTNWSVFITAIFNGSIIFLASLIWHHFEGGTGKLVLAKEVQEELERFNLAGVGMVVLIMMIYFSYTNKVNSDTIIRANFILERKNKEISEQHHHVQILLKEVHHRVKNNLQIISSLLSMQTRSVTDEDVLGVLDESRRRVDAIALIHQKLYSNIQGNQVDFNSYLKELIKTQQIIQSDIDCQLETIDLLLDLDIAVPLGLIVSEMITNSVKHAFKDNKNPVLHISLKENRNGFELIFHDNGVGLPSDFDLESADSLGMEIIAALIDQIDAKIEYNNDNGARFKINFEGID